MSGDFLVVEDDELVALWLRRAFAKFRPVTVASTVAAATATLLEPNREWSALVVDIGLPDGSGLEVVRVARATVPSIAVLVLTGSTQPKVVNGSFLLGASFLRKPTTADSLELFARRAIALERVKDSRILRVVDNVATEWGLTDREAEVLGLATGDTPRSELADVLGVTENTAKAHVKSLLRKSAARSIDHVVQQVLRRALQI